MNIEPEPAVGRPEPVGFEASDSASSRIEHDARSRATLSSGSADPLALRFEYALGPGEPAGQYVALVQSVSDLARFDRVSFRASADRPMRLAVQLRAPWATDGHRWLRSVYVDSTARDLTVTFHDMRPVDHTLHGRARAGADRQPLVCRGHHARQNGGYRRGEAGEYPIRTIGELGAGAEACRAGHRPRGTAARASRRPCYVLTVSRR